MFYKALDWLVAGTMVLFVRSVWDLIYYILFMYIRVGGFWMFRIVSWMTMILAAEFHSRAVVLQLKNSGRLPVWLLPEIGTGG